MAAEGIQRLEQYLNARLKLSKPHQQIHVVAVPVSRDYLRIERISGERQELVPRQRGERGTLPGAQVRAVPGL